MVCFLIEHVHVVQVKLEAAQHEAQVLEIKRQGQLKALEAQKARKQVCTRLLPRLTEIVCQALSMCSVWVILGSLPCCCWLQQVMSASSKKLGCSPTCLDATCIAKIAKHTLRQDLF